MHTGIMALERINIETTKITADGLPIEIEVFQGEFSAPYLYSLFYVNKEETKERIDIPFQNGVSSEVGQNGITIEALIQICQHRLNAFQAGAFPCEENEQALSGLEQAMKALNERTAKREAAGVEHKALPI
jgi:hypothetical protein